MRSLCVQGWRKTEIKILGVQCREGCRFGLQLFIFSDVQKTVLFPTYPGSPQGTFSGDKPNSRQNLINSYLTKQGESFLFELRGENLVLLLSEAEFEHRLKFETWLKHGWFHFKLYSQIQDLSRRSIGTGFWRFSEQVYKFFKFYLRNEFLKIFLQIILWFKIKHLKFVIS